MNFHPHPRAFTSIQFQYSKELKGRTYAHDAGARSQATPDEVAEAGRPSDSAGEQGRCWIQGDRWRWEVLDAHGQIARITVCDGRRTVESTPGSTMATSMAPRPFNWAALGALGHSELDLISWAAPFHYAGDVLFAGEKCERFEYPDETPQHDSRRESLVYTRSRKTGLLLQGRYSSDVPMEYPTGTPGHQEDGRQYRPLAFSELYRTTLSATMALSSISLNVSIPSTLFHFPPGLALSLTIYEPRTGFPPPLALLEWIRTLPHRWKTNPPMRMVTDTTPYPYFRWLPLAYERLAIHNTPEAFRQACQQDGLNLPGDAPQDFLVVWMNTRHIPSLLRLGPELGVESYLRQRDRVLTDLSSEMVKYQERTTASARSAALQQERDKLLAEVKKSFLPSDQDGISRQLSGELEEALSNLQAQSLTLQNTFHKQFSPDEIDTLIHDPQSPLHKTDYYMVRAGLTEARYRVRRMKAQLAFLSAETPKAFQALREEAGLHPNHARFFPSASGMHVAHRQNFLYGPPGLDGRESKDGSFYNQGLTLRAHEHAEFVPPPGMVEYEQELVTDPHTGEIGAHRLHQFHPVFPERLTEQAYRAFRQEAILNEWARRETHRRRPDLSGLYPTMVQQPIWIGLRLETDSGKVKVSSVTPQGAGEKAGVKVGDFLTKVEGQSVLSPMEFTDKLRGHAKGTRLRLSGQRKDSPLSLTLTIP